MGLFDVFNDLHQKKKTYQFVTTSNILFYLRCLSSDKDNLDFINKIVINNYQFYVAPLYIYYLLFFGLPKKSRANIKMFKKEEKTTEELYDKIKYCLDWSGKELKYHRALLDKLIDKDYWCQQLGVINGKK